MPWPINFIGTKKLDDAFSPQVGDAWYREIAPDSKGCYGPLAPKYFRDHQASRLPIVVMMPGGDFFCVDTQATGGSDGWTVTGELPNISVSPSINLVGRYHGWIKDGVISDDCDGRRLE